MKSGEKFLLGAGDRSGRGARRDARRCGRGAPSDFAGRVVVITGGSRGLGLVMARQLAAEGARLCLLARDEDGARRARAKSSPDRPGEILTRSAAISADAPTSAPRSIPILERWSCD